MSATLAWSGAAVAVGRAAGTRALPLVVGYHRVVEDFESERAYGIAASLVSVKTLSRQIDWIARRYAICSLDELDSPDAAGYRRGKPRAAITFDDGYADVYHIALPLLHGKGIPFAVFISPGLVGTSDLFLHDELYLRLCALMSQVNSRGIVGFYEMLHRTGLWRAVEDLLPAASRNPYGLTRAILSRFRQSEIKTMVGILRARTVLSEAAREKSRVMNWGMVRHLHRSGVMIGCHTTSHAILTRENEGTVISEVAGGRDLIERRLGVSIEHFAYPDGAFNAATVQAVAAAGFRRAYTVCCHREVSSPELTIPRRMLWERSNVNALGRFSGSILSCQVNGVFDVLAPCASAH